MNYFTPRVFGLQVSNFSIVYDKYNRNHFDWSFIEDLPNNPEIITILRHPVDRAISRVATSVRRRFLGGYKFL